MHDELLQFQRNVVCTLVPRPEGEHIIGTRWYALFTLPFAFFFHVSCINSWFLGKFSDLCKIEIFDDSSQIF